MILFKKDHDCCFECNLFEHKRFCISLSRFLEQEYDVFLKFKITTRESHAGLELDIQVERLRFFIELTDRRHWDYDNDTYLPLGEV
jgi:hypothetical protein